MTTIPIEAQISTDQLLHAIEQLPPHEFATFLARLLDLQTRRVRGLQETEMADHPERQVELAAQVHTDRQRIHFDAPLPGYPVTLPRVT
jgi:hypothetical protein